MIANTAYGQSGRVNFNIEERLIVASLKDTTSLKRATKTDVFTPPVSPKPPIDENDERGNVVAALRAEDLRGPWINANVSIADSRSGEFEGLNVALACDSFCPTNILSESIVRAVGLEVEEKEGAVFGVGDGQLRLSGSTTADVRIGRTTRSVSFEVSPDVEGFAFFSFPEQCRWGFTIDTTRRSIQFDDDVVPYFRSKAESLQTCGRLASVKLDLAKAPKVVLENSVVVPPSGSAEGYLTRGQIVGDIDTSVDICFEPSNLKMRYGMTGPRIVQRVGKEGFVSVIINNPFPVPIKLFRGACVGHVFEAEVDDRDPKVMNEDPKTSPDQHPVDKLEGKIGKGIPGWTAERMGLVQEMLRRRHRAFSRGDHDQGRTDWTSFDIELKAGCEAPIAEPQRTYSIHKREMIEEVVQGLLDKDFIEASTSAYRAWPVLAKKKDPETGLWIPNKRFCIDYRALNAATVKWSRLLCKVPEVLNAMSGASWFSSIDLVGAYHQVPVNEMSRPKLAFTVPGSGRQYQWKVLPFGVANAGACFSQLMETVLTGMSYRCALAYLDDVIVWSNSFEEHLADVEAVLERLELAGLKARPQKCNFFVKEVHLLGHVVTPEGVKPDPLKTKAVKEWPKPRDAKEMVSFLAFCNFYRRFIKGFSEVAYPLQKLTHDGVEWEWKEPQREAFEALKQALCSEPVMRMPDVSKPWVLDSDWSRRGIAWVLQQEGDDGKLHPVLYGSRSLTKSEQRYGSTRGEFLAMFEGIQNCRHYLLNGDFCCRVDNKALTYLKSYKDLTHRTARALELLADYGDFGIKYIQGKKNIPADCLSRVPWKETTFSQIDVSEILAPMATRSSKDAKDDKKADGEDREGPKNWAKAQAADRDLQRLREWLKDGGRPPRRETSALSPALKSYWASFDQFKLVNGVVCRVWTDEMGGDNLFLKVVPEEWRHQLLLGYHDDQGHPGMTRLNATLKKKYYWYAMGQDAQRFVDSCKLCQVVKPNRAKAPLQQHPLGYFGQRCFWDIKGPLSVTTRGNRFYIIVVDGFSKWTAVIPVPDITAQTVYQAFYDSWVCQNGCPVSLHSDRGSSLVGKVGQAVVDLLNIQQTTTVSHHQMGNGQAETKVKESMRIIARILQEEDSLMWDVACPKTALAMNTTVNSVTGQTPWLIKHGQGEEALLPADLAVGNLPEGKDVDVVVRGLRSAQRRIYEKVVAATGSSLRRQKRNYDRTVAGQQIEVGDLVRYENHQVDDGDKSFTPKFRDVLFKVEEVLSEGVNYRLKSVDLAKPLGLVAHFNQLKRVAEPREAEPGVGRQRRDRRRPARLDDYEVDLADGVPQLK